MRSGESRLASRPSYARVKTALRAIASHPDLELQLVVAASALLERYGTAVNYVEQDGFKVLHAAQPTVQPVIERRRRGKWKGRRR